MSSTACKDPRAPLPRSFSSYSYRIYRGSSSVGLNRFRGFKGFKKVKTGGGYLRAAKPTYKVRLSTLSTAMKDYAIKQAVAFAKGKEIVISLILQKKHIKMSNFCPFI